MNLRFLPITLAISAAFAGAAQAQSLMSLYETARGYDAAFKAAQSQYTANLSKGDQAKALLLPTVGLSATVNKTEVELIAAGQTVNAQSKAATLSASQPLYRPANFANYQQGMRQLELASVQLKAAEQDLMVRLSQAYFDVLVSRESLDFVKAQKVAVAEQLAAAKRNFEVGTSTITDTREKLQPTTICASSGWR
jgi:outer membrane protein